MQNVVAMTHQLEKAFEPTQAALLATVISESYNELVKTSDFNELKAIVKEIAIAQQHTDASLQELSAEVKGLSAEVKGLSAAQQQTEEAIQKMTQAMSGIGSELGGLSRSMSYSLENEAYRLLPGLLQERLGVRLSERIVRTEINGEEINFLAMGERDGKQVLLVGEGKLQLGDRFHIRRAAQEAFDQLERKVEAAQEHYPDHEVIRLLVTHYARPAVLEMAAARNVTVIQSFEW